MKDLFSFSKRELLSELWDSDREIYKILRQNRGVHYAREEIFSYLNSLERHYFNINSKKTYRHMDMLERNNAKECIRVLKNIIRTENESLTGFSALSILCSIANMPNFYEVVSESFISEFIFLFKGINGKSQIFPDIREVVQFNDGRKGALLRSEQLDRYSENMRRYSSRYISGLDTDVENKRNAMKKDILKYFRASEKDWSNPDWHIKNVITDYRILEGLVSLSDEERSGLINAERLKIPIQITPYYLSLFDKEGISETDRCIRCQVIPSTSY